MYPFLMTDKELDKVIDDYVMEDPDDMTDDERREWDHDPDDCHAEDCPYCEPDYKEKGY